MVNVRAFECARVPALLCGVRTKYTFYCKQTSQQHKLGKNAAPLERVADADGQGRMADFAVN